MTGRRQRRQHRDSGASLIMTIGFVLAIGLIGGGLASLATSGLNSRATLQILRNRQYAADGAIEQAISSARGRTCASIELASGADGPTLSTLNGVAIRVDWVNACGVVQAGDRGTAASAANSDGTVVAQRNVIFSACIDTGGACVASNVIIRAQVNFEQGVSGAVTKTYVQSWSVNR